MLRAYIFVIQDSLTNQPIKPTQQAKKTSTDLKEIIFKHLKVKFFISFVQTGGAASLIVIHRKYSLLELLCFLLILHVHNESQEKSLILYSKTFTQKMVFG